jgi:hypothetical protein
MVEVKTIGIAYRVKYGEAKRLFLRGGTVLVEERDRGPVVSVTNITTTHSGDAAAWEALASSISEWRNRYPRQRLYVFDRDVSFFYEQAACSYDPKTETIEEGTLRGAIHLAKAEAEAKRRGWWVTTVTDPEGPMEDDAGSVEYVESGEGVCLNVDLWRDSGGIGLIRDDERLQSLGNVIVPDSSDPYIRVVGAELASEQLAQEGWEA